jgi:two-component system, sensor histidine kinase and response regulator
LFTVISVCEFGKLGLHAIFADRQLLDANFAVRPEIVLKYSFMSSPSRESPPLASGLNAVSWLKQLPLFADVAVESLELFVPAMSARELASSEVLFRQGDLSSDVYLLTRGDTVIQIEQDGRLVAKDFVPCGGCVGEMAALTGNPRSATVVAGQQGAGVLIIPGPRFRDLLLLQPSLGVNMLAMMSERLRQTELRKQHAALAQRADELGKSKEAADAAIRAKADLLASMSHELRTPLNGIIGLTEMVLGTSLTYSQREYLNLVRESGESLLALINDVLDMSKIEAGRLELEVEPFELRDRLIETLKSLAVRAHRKGVELACRVAPEVPDRVRGDLARLRQIVVNLVGNAIKFTERGEVVVEVTCPQRTVSAVTLQVTVRDTGIGIPKETLAQLFQPYTQADASISRRFGGTGLGLSIAAKLVAGMRGRIWVDSMVGVGSEFHFAVELEIDHSADSSPILSRQPALAGKRALLVQSQATTAKILEETLIGWGMNVVIVASGAAGAQEAERGVAEGRPFSFLLMDVRAPESVNWLQRIREGKNLSARMLLTADLVNEGARCEELQIPHLLRPVKPSELLNSLLEDSWAADSVPEDAPMLQCSAKETPSIAPMAAEGSLSGGKILLAEDGLVNQKVALSHLAKGGHQVTVVTTGKEALAALERQSFDLVLMDVMMPEMNGLDATQAIRARELGTEQHLPIIAMTASNTLQDIQRCLTAGMDAYVSKPIHREQLFATLHEFLPSRNTSASEIRRGAVDWPAALQQVGGQHDQLAERVSLLQQEIPRVERDLLAAAAAWNPPSLRIAAHTLKVALQAFGAPKLANLARQLEDAAGRQDQSRTQELLVEFKQEMDRLVAALKIFTGENVP